jgi:microcystin-dependent protein
MEMPKHSHAGIVATPARAPASNLNPAFSGSNLPQGKGDIGYAGGDEPHENMPPFIALLYCIKK